METHGNGGNTYTSDRAADDRLGYKVITDLPREDMASTTPGNDGFNDSLCSADIPSAFEAFEENQTVGTVAAVLGSLLVVLVIAIYIEEAVFIVKRFTIETRKYRTIWILGLYPMLAVCSFLGAMIPRSAVFVDMVSNSYFATCMYIVVLLMEDYMGGRDIMLEIIKDTTIDLRGPPCCCCCRCIHVRPFNRKTYRRLVIMTLQVAIIRPILMFVAAVMWADGSYAPGVISLGNGFAYIQVLNIVSTMFSIYGMLHIRKAFTKTLKNFRITGKLAAFQLCLLASIIPNVIMSILVIADQIPCSGILNTQSRSQRITNTVELFLSILLTFVARYFFRRAQDGNMVAGPEPEETVEKEKALELRAYAMDV